MTPAGYFLTFSTYGSHLPGNEQVSTSRRQNGILDPRIGPRPGLEAKMRELMRHRAVILDRRMRTEVESAIRERCVFRGWILHALNVRTNHVHVVVSAEDEAPERVLQQLKGRATRYLRDAGLCGPDAPVWARHGSTRMVWDEAGLTEVVDYVLFRQGEPLT